MGLSAPSEILSSFVKMTSLTPHSQRLTFLLAVYAREALFVNAEWHVGEGFDSYYPENWTIPTQEELEQAVTLRLQEEGNPAAQIIA